MGATVTINFDESRIAAAVREAAAQALNAAANDLNGKMRQAFGSGGGGVAGTVAFRLGKNRKGQTVRKRSTKARYAASPPGTPPGIRTGRLRNSVTSSYATIANLRAVVGTNLAYGKNLEYGFLAKARDGSTSHVPARPWAIPTLKANKARLLQVMASTFQRSLRKALAGGAKK